MACKLVTASSENRMEVHLKVKLDLPYDLVGPLLALSPEKTRIRKTQAGNPALHQYLAEPRLGSNQNVHQPMNAQSRSGPRTQGKITPIKHKNSIEKSNKSKETSAFVCLSGHILL